MVDISNFEQLKSQNIELSKLKKIDILHLVRTLADFHMLYRTDLGLPKNATFGYELEYEGISKALSDQFINTYTSNYQSKIDVSLDSGGEIISPKLTDTQKIWSELLLICDFLSSHNAITTENAGLHISAGTQLLNKDAEAWATLIELYMAFERILIRFGYGDKLNARKSFFYSRPVGVQLLLSRNLIEKTTLLNIKKFLWQVRQDKYNAINFRSLSFSDQEFRENTCEFRFFNSTSQAVIIQNDINVIMKMFMSAANKSIDRDFLKTKLAELESEIVGHKNYLQECNRIHLEESLLFADLIFDNLLDKIYFLKQYLKDFSTVLHSENVYLARGLS